MGEDKLIDDMEIDLLNIIRKTCEDTILSRYAKKRLCDSWSISLNELIDNPNATADQMRVARKALKYVLIKRNQLN